MLASLNSRPVVRPELDPRIQSALQRSSIPPVSHPSSSSPVRGSLSLGSRFFERAHLSVLFLFLCILRRDLLEMWKRLRFECSTCAGLMSLTTSPSVAAHFTGFKPLASRQYRGGIPFCGSRRRRRHISQSRKRRTSK